MNIEKRDNFRIERFEVIPENDCQALAYHLQDHPISVGIAGYHLIFYNSGLFTDCDKNVNHAVLLVGYKKNYGWKIKNTWGTKWGENGFAWISEQNNCEICKIAQFPIPILKGKKFDPQNKMKTCPG